MEEQDRINTVAQRWKDQYQSKKSEIYKKLCALNNPTEKQIADIISNESWATNECDMNVFAIILVYVFHS